VDVIGTLSPTVSRPATAPGTAPRIGMRATVAGRHRHVKLTRLMLQVLLLVGYAIGLAVLGFVIGRRVTGTSSFMVAGRGLGPGLLFATMLAANIGAGSTVGAASLGYRFGLSAWWWVGSAGIGSVVLGLWIGPRLRRIAATHDLRTVGDFLEWRYDHRVRLVITALLWCATLAIMAAQLIALAWVLNVVGGWPKWAGCVAGGLLMTVYFTAGGLLSTAWVNLVQLAVLLVGFGLAVPLGWSAAGGLEGLHTLQVPDAYWHLGQHDSSGWIYLAMLGPAFIVSPGLVQKVFAARDDRSVRVGVVGMGVVLLAFAMVPPLLGMLARVLHPDLTQMDMALPMLLLHDLPPWVGLAGLAALVSAEVSSADAALFMLSTSFSQDIYKRFIRRDATDEEVLRVARLAAVAGGVLGVTLALVAESVIDALGIFYTLLSVSLFVPVLAGLFARRVGSNDALAAIAAGVLAVGVTSLMTGFPAWWLTPAMIGLTAAVAAAMIGTTLRAVIR
jgi:solute:Na+ symporter, SSS family